MKLSDGREVKRDEAQLRERALGDRGVYGYVSPQAREWDGEA